MQRAHVVPLLGGGAIDGLPVKRQRAFRSAGTCLLGIFKGAGEHWSSCAQLGSTAHFSSALTAGQSRVERSAPVTTRMTG